MAQWRNTVYTEHAPDSPNEKWGPGNSSMTRQFDITNGSFQGRIQAAYDFLGFQVILSTAGSAPPYYIHRITPMPYGGLAQNIFTRPPDDTAPGGFLPDLTNRFYVGTISRTEPLGAMQGVNVAATPPGTAAANYVRARLTCELSTLPFWVKPDSAVLAGTGPLAGFPDEGTALSLGWAKSRYIIRQIKEFNRLIKIPFGVMKVGGVFTKVPIPFREGGANVTYTWMRVPLEGFVPGVNFGVLGSAQGTINNATFDIYDAQTLLFDTFSTREYQGAFGERLADVTFNMIYMPHPSTGNNFNGGQGNPAGKKLGWNYFFDSVGGKLDYYLATQTDGVTPIYRTSDFSALFRP